MADQNLIDWEFCFSRGMQATTPNTTNGTRSYITQITTQNNDFQGKFDHDIDRVCLNYIRSFCIKDPDTTFTKLIADNTATSVMLKSTENVFLKRISELNNSNILSIIYNQIHLYWNIRCFLDLCTKKNENNTDISSNINIITSILESVASNCMIAKPYNTAYDNRYILPDFTEEIEIDKRYSILSMYRNLTTFEHYITSADNVNAIFQLERDNIDNVKTWLNPHKSEITLPRALELIRDLNQKTGYDYVSSDNLWKKYPFVNHSIADVAKALDALITLNSFRRAGVIDNDAMTDNN